MGKNLTIKISETQHFINWVSKAIFLDSNAEKAQKRIVKRGEVYWCEFGYNVGHEMRKTTPRPCIIIQSDFINNKSPNVIVCPFTHNKKDISCLVNLNTYVGTNGAMLTGRVNVANITCISKARLMNKIIEKPVCKADMQKIDKAIINQLGLFASFKTLQDKCTNQNNKIKRMYEKHNMLKKQIEYIYNHFNVSSFEELKIKLEKSIDK